MSEEKRRRLGLPAWILMGALIGIATGIFFGEYAKVLAPIGDAYIQLLAVCVFPYLIASLLHGLGKLDPATAVRLFKNAWYSYLIGWGIVILAMMLLAAAFPTASTPAVLDLRGGTQRPDIVALLIPGNLFADLTRNAVPAVVVFALLYGLAIQRVKNKETWLGILEVIKSASVTIWNWLVFVAPAGVFALFAGTAGTLESKDIGGFVLYVTLFLFGTFLLAFWILPALLSCIIPVGYREVLRELREAFVLALVTTLSVVALPGIIQATRKILEKCGVKDERASDVIGTNVSVAYPLAQLGNLGVILFFFFCAFYYQVPLALGDKILLPFITLLSTMGSPSTTVTAVPFMASVFHTPDSTLELYMATMTFTRYGQVALSVAGIALVTLLPTLAFYGKMRVRPLRLAGALVLGFGLMGSVVVVLRSLEPRLLAGRQAGYLTYSVDSRLAKDLDVTVYRTLEEVPQRPEVPQDLRDLDRIRRTGTLRVGYDPVVIPFCYLNRDGQLVGYDVAFMHRLAKDMNVRLEFVPMTHENVTSLLTSGEIDMAANGIYVTDERLRRFTMSKPYIVTPPALLVRSPIARRFINRKAIATKTDLKVACMDSPALLPLAMALFPASSVVPVRSYDDLLTDPSLQVGLWSLIQARAFAMAHPGFTAVVPEDLGSPFLVAYLLPPGAEQFPRYLDHWIEIRQADGFAQEQYRYWIEGVTSEKKERRWCILRNVLHWVD